MDAQIENTDTYRAVGHKFWPNQKVEEVQHHLIKTKKLFFFLLLLLLHMQPGIKVQFKLNSVTYLSPDINILSFKSTFL